jgi:hypothetical protein
MRRILWFFPLAFTLLIGCSDDKESSEKASSTNLPGEYLSVLTGLCETIDRCPNVLPRPIAYRTKNECAAILGFAFTCRITDTDLPNDTTVYGVKQVIPNIDEAAAKTCLEWLKTTSCSQINIGGQDSPCSNLLMGSSEDEAPSGSAGLNDECNGDYDCQADFYCLPATADEMKAISYCQVCVPRVAQGTECQQGLRMCQDGLHCSYVQDAARQCLPPSADGGRCVESEECASEFCNYALDELGGWGKCDAGGKPGDVCRVEPELNSMGSDCRQESFCDQGTCAERKPSGASCEAERECAKVRCIDGTCGTPDGTSCYERGECASNLCIDDLCGGPAGACQGDENCPAGQTCSTSCRPPNCFCSGSGCSVGTCSVPDSGNSNNDVETCTDDYDCLSQSCDNGVCAPMPAIGDACSDSYQCYPLGFCSGGTCVQKFAPGKDCSGGIDSCEEPFLCIEGRCEIMNLSCEPAPAGSLCTFLRVCDENSWCDLIGGVRCRPRAALGQECQNSPIRGVETCAVGSLCLAGDDGVSRCSKSPAVGEACTSTCADGAACYQGTCAAPPVGQACDPYGTGCPEGFVCADRRDYICVPPSLKDQECRDTMECAPGLFCENYRSCVDRKVAGTECSDTVECLENLWCNRDSRTCEPRATQGTECRTYEDACALGFYCDSSTCEALKAPGESCSSDEVCASGACYGSGFCLGDAQCVVPI